MQTIGERLKYSIEKQGISVRAFANKFAMNYSGLTQIINNERSLGMNILHQVKLGIPDLDTEWLLFGTKRETVSNNVNTQTPSIVAEAAAVYQIIDPGAEALLKYLELDAVKEKIKQILKS